MKTKILIVLAIALIASACKKKGCTDPASVVYDSEAEKDDGSCRYVSSAIFWSKSCQYTDDSIGNSASDNGIIIYVDGIRAGNITWCFPANINNPQELPSYYGEGETIPYYSTEKSSNHTYRAERVISPKKVWTGSFSLSSPNKIFIELK